MLLGRVSTQTQRQQQQQQQLSDRDGHVATPRTRETLSRPATLASISARAVSAASGTSGGGGGPSLGDRPGSALDGDRDTVSQPAPASASASASASHCVNAALSLPHLHAELQALARQRDALQVENAVLRARAEPGDDGPAVAALEQRVMQLFARVRDLEAGEEAYVEERRALAAEVEGGREALEALSKHSLERDDRLRAAEEEIAAAARRRAELEEDLSRFKSRSRRLEAEAARLQEASQRQRSKCQSLGDELTAVDAEARAARARVKELTALLETQQEATREALRAAKDAESEAKAASSDRDAVLAVLDDAKRSRTATDAETEETLMALRKECRTFLAAASESHTQLATERQRHAVLEAETAAKLVLERRAVAEAEERRMEGEERERELRKRLASEADSNEALKAEIQTKVRRRRFFFCFSHFFDFFSTCSVSPTDC
jgi:chromosome segregation ATPase